MSDTEITRVVQIEDRTTHIHIHLTEDEIRRLLLPHVVDAFASELQRRTPRIHDVTSNSTAARGTLL